jgi:hypothetical protein
MSARPLSWVDTHAEATPVRSSGLARWVTLFELLELIKPF